jgi:DNA-binding MarR family transcriptional regulator
MPPVPSRALAPKQLRAYFALMEVSSILRHSVEQHLHADGDLSYVQFEILARLNDQPTGSMRMTDLADGLVYSRSGLTYQAGLLEKRGLIERRPSAEDERSVVVSVTDAGRELIAVVLPGHIEVVRELLFDPLSDSQLDQLTELLTPVREQMLATPPRSAAPRRRR